MRQLNREQPFSLPVKFIQFGEGNFLRAYIDWMIDILNERTGLNAGVVVVRPRGHTVKPLLDTQGGMFTTLVQGLNEDGQAVRQFRRISCVQREINAVTMHADFLALARNPDTRFVVSNTTEAGIVVNNDDRFDDTPAASFPAKLTRLLYERYVHFKGSPKRGWIMLPCELIEHNGSALKAAVLHFAQLWSLSATFCDWVETANTFCSTMVDRIVTGYPDKEIAAIEAELGYADQFLVAAEYYYVLIIEGPASLTEELRLQGANLNVKLVDDIAPYRQAKVGILNGGHTTLVPVGLLAGLESVAEAVDDPDVGAFLTATLHDEIIPALPLPRADLEEFTAEVLRRFRNPYIHHRLAAIALNSWPKFAARVLPQLLHYRTLQDRLPQRLILALAATMVLYRGDVIELADDAQTLAWFKRAWRDADSGASTIANMAEQWLANVNLWGADLNDVTGLTEALGVAIALIERVGMRGAIKALQ